MYYLIEHRWIIFNIKHNALLVIYSIISRYDILLFVLVISALTLSYLSNHHFKVSHSNWAVPVSVCVRLSTDPEVQQTVCQCYNDEHAVFIQYRPLLYILSWGFASSFLVVVISGSANISYRSFKSTSQCSLIGWFEMSIGNISAHWQLTWRIAALVYDVFRAKHMAKLAGISLPRVYHRAIKMRKPLWPQ